MIKNLHLKTMLLLCAMVMGIGSAWAQEVTIASFSNAANEGWTINNAEYATAGGGYYKLTSSDASIVTPSINWTEYTDITIIISARKFGGPDATQGKIAVSQGEVELATYSPSGTSIAASSALSISPTDGVITISCPGASSNKGCGVQSIVIKAKDPSGGDIQTVATPTFSPAGGTYAEVKNVTISTETENATIYYTTNGTDPTISSNVYSSAISVSKTTTIKAMAVKEGMNNSAVATATYTINLPYSGDGYVRINSLSDLTDGAKVIIAARYNETANDYYAMTAATTGKPAGVAFASTTTSKGEELPSTILDNESTYYWTVKVTTDGYTFTNSDKKVLGCTSDKTDFAEGGNNTAWTITRETSSSALETGYEGFCITNKNNNKRGVALNIEHNYGTYATSNNNNSNYNFYLDFFVEGARPVPSISANNVDIAYDAIEGSISYTLNNGVNGGEVTVNTEAEWLTLGTVGEMVPFTCTANTETTERTATVTLTYTYGDNETITKVVTVTQAAAPILYTTIPAIFNAATETATDVNVTFDNWVVSGVKGSNTYVTDNNGNGFIIYTSNHGFEINDKLSGTVSGTPLKLFNGSAEFTNLTASTTGLTVSKDGSITVITDKAIADLGGVNTGAVISLSNLTYDGTNLSDGTNTIKPYTTLYNGTFVSGKTYNVTGVYLQYNNTKEILPRSAADIEEVEVEHEQYTLTVSGLVNVNTFVFAGDESEMLFEGESSAQVYDGTEVMISLDPDEGYVLQSLMVDGVEHKADIDGGMYIFTMPAHDVTVTATAVEATTYTLATSITSGKHYVIAASTSSTTKAMGGKNESKNYYNAVDVSLDGNTLTVTDNSDVQEFVIYGPNADGYYTIYDPVARGYLYASSSSSNDLKYQTENDANGLWEINFNEGTATAKGTNSRNILSYNSSSPRFSCYSSKQTAIKFYEKVGEVLPTTVSVPVTIAKYATYCSENALNFEGTGLTAYIASLSGTNVTFTKVTNIPANTGVLLKGPAGNYNIPVIETSSTDVENNALVGVITNTEIPAGSFVLMNIDNVVGFYKTTAASFTVGAHTAYIEALPSGARNFIAIDGEATAIKAIESKQQSGEIFNLAGQRVKSAQKGLYIIDGKKVVIK